MNQEPVRNEGLPAQKRKMNGCLLAALIVVGAAILTVGGCFIVSGAAIFGFKKQQEEQQFEKLQGLDSATTSDFQPTGELADIFKIVSDSTDIQRDNKEKEIKGSVVEWTLPVYEVNKTGECYRITTRSGTNVGTSVTISPRDQDERAFIEALKTGDPIRFKGFINGVTMRNLNIEPAILTDPNVKRGGKVANTEASKIPTEAKKNAPQETLGDAEPVYLDPIKLGEMFNLLSDFTDVQRDNKEKEIKGAVVEWSLPVYEVSKSGKNYLITTVDDDNVGSDVTISPRDKSEQAFIEQLKTGDIFRFKGVIKDVSMLRRLKIEPAILRTDASPSTVEEPTYTPVDLKSIAPSDLFPYVKGNPFINPTDFVGKVVEWTLTVKDLKQIAKGYLVEAFHDGNSSVKVEIMPQNDEEEERIKSLQSGSKITFRGQIIEASEARYGPVLTISPAILLVKNAVQNKHLDGLQTLKGEHIDFSDLQKEIKLYPTLTTLKKEDLKIRLGSVLGEIAEGNIKEWILEKTSSGYCLEREDGDIHLLVFINATSEGELARFDNPANDTHDRPEVRFRGYINRIVIDTYDNFEIRIGPAILTDSPTDTAQPKQTQTLPMTPASIAGGAPPTVQTMTGERYPETRLQLLEPADFMDLNLNDVRYAINEMYARHGAVFKNVEIAKSFANKEWFKPRPGVRFEEIEKDFSAIEADNLKLLGRERERKEATADLYELIDSESNLRDGPGTNYPIVRKSRKGEVGEALSNKKGWMKLQFSDGSMAWAHEQNLKSKK